MTSAGFFGSEIAECPALSYFWLAELLALSICMNPTTLQKNFGHLYLQTCYFGAYLPVASQTRAFLMLSAVYFHSPFKPQQGCWDLKQQIDIPLFL